MKRMPRSTRSWIALAIWGTGLLVFFGLGFWNLAASRQDAENRLIGEAGRAAAQIAGILGMPGAKLTPDSAKAAAMAAMEDERIYAIKVEGRHGVLEGQRRNYLWEPIDWDDEIAENCVQGMNPLRIDGRHEGIVEVWLSQRLADEEHALLASRELLRFFCIALLWTCCFALLLWSWGEFARWRKLWLTPDEAQKPASNDEIMLGLAPKKDGAPGPEGMAAAPLIDARAGRAFQRRHPEAWLVTAGMFRQTFARAPQLISRLYSEGSAAGLCHLGRMLELAAPCIGATPLAQAAQAMQSALNDPDCNERALPVEECARVLEQTLDALQGKCQWQAKSEKGE